MAAPSRTSGGHNQRFEDRGARMEELPVTNEASGEPLSTTNKLLGSGASMVQVYGLGAKLQDFRPVSQICAHLNAFHAYASDPGRAVESNHYCAHINEDVRQCLVYDSPEANARLIGVEYMITPRLFKTLDSEEKKLWHSHVFEVKSGMLIMPAPRGVPDSVWEKAETTEMEEVVELYGKVYHFWQTDKGHKLPLGQPQLMTSYISADQFDFGETVGKRDQRFKSDHGRKQEIRSHIPEPDIDPNADATWRK